MFNDIQPGLKANSNTAVVCALAQLYGAGPEPGEHDPREIWDPASALYAANKAFLLLAEIGSTGYQLADESGSLLWGFVNLFDSQVRRIDRLIDRHMPRLQDLQKEQDGTEIKSCELEEVTGKVQNLTARRDAFEQVRDMVSERYLEETGTMWRPMAGSHTSQTGALTSSVIDARDFIRARKERETQSHLPEGTIVAITAGRRRTRRGVPLP